MNRALLASLTVLVACSSPTPAEPLPQAAAEANATTELAETVVTPTEPETVTYEVVNTFPHDPTAFTQGLFIHDGALYESTGRYGTSTLRRVDLETGELERVRALPGQYFGEGSAAVDNTIVMLTWRSGVGIVFNRETFAPQRSFTYPGEGWGLTGDGTKLYLSDGSPVIRVLDPTTFAQTGELTVTYAGSPLPRLNELEWIDGEIWANVWQTDQIAIIDPKSGAVTRLIDLTGLHPASERDVPLDDVLNGIAYNATTGQIYVTGKNWPQLYEIRLVDQD
ncbi:MAG: glutaminyl-peptide cyclotransferase [Pseudomonadota bacterium]